MKVKTRNLILKGMTAVMLTLAIVTSSTFANPMKASAMLSDNGPDNKYYESRTVNEVMEDSAKLNLEVANEGYVLFKNNANALPLSKNELKVTVLGERAYDLYYGGAGSGALGTPGLTGDNAQFESATFEDAMEVAGFTMNTAVAAAYKAKTFNPSTAKYFADSFVKYNTALVVLGRTGSEFVDNAAHHVAGHTNVNDHYLMLEDAERELLTYAKANFDKVVVIINSPNVMEIDEIQNDDGVDAILWIGQPGYNGVLSVGPILKGEINPSGRTVDFWMSDAKKDPTWYNFGDNAQAHYALGTSAINPVTGLAETAATYNTDSAMGWKTANQDTTQSEINIVANQAAYVALDYAEGIYVGYRYYETMYTELENQATGTGATWYDAATIYPFGYGLSYTTFTQEIQSRDGNLTNDEITFTVRVTNTGTKAGKDVVQIYNTPPYTRGKIDKASVNLVGFGKSGIIQPGAYEDVDVTIRVKDLASFDYNDANGNSFNGYELEEGDYILSIRNNSHDVLASVVLNSAGRTWNEDSNSATPNNIFSQSVSANATNGWSQYNTLAHEWVVGGEAKTGGYLTRDELLTRDLKTLAWMETASNDFKRETFNAISVQHSDFSYEDYDNALTAAVETNYTLNPWLRGATDITGWEQRATAYGNYAAPIQLSDMAGVPLEGTTKLGDQFPAVIANMTGKEAWTAFMNQLTWEEMTSGVFNSQSYRNGQILSIGKEVTNDQDGPGQLKDANNSNPTVNAYDGNSFAWCCEVVQASTWNVELIEELGKNIGDGAILIGVNGWYGPAMNTHRNILAGRNFEYYSQDGIQGGLIAAAAIKGAQSRGVHVYAKHCFLNDQETNRMSTVTFATEQAIREIYARQFELAIVKGNANGTMTAFNRIGVQPALSYAVNIQMFEKEWGFEAISVTDMYTSQSQGGWTGNALARGHVFPLGTLSGQAAGMTLDGSYDATAKMVKVGSYVEGAYNATTLIDSPTQWYSVRSTTQMWLYVIVNLSGNLNGYRDVYLANQTIEKDQGTRLDSLNISVFGSYKAKALAALGEGGYTVSATGLPSGVTVSRDGYLKGVAATSGDSTFTVTMRGIGGQHYIADTATITLKVASKMTLSAATATLGTAYTGSVEQPFYAAADYSAVPRQFTEADMGKVFGTYAATGLPAGITLNANTGALTGTPTKAGTYTVNLTFTASTAAVTSEMAGYKSYGAEKLADYTSTATLTVGGGFTVTLNDGTTSVEQTVLTGAKIVAPANPTKGVEFKFLGWSKTEGGEVVNLANETVSADVTYYAVWEAVPEFTMGEDGYWYNYGTKTENKWQGIKGDKGDVGTPGAEGPVGPAGADAKGCGSSVSMESPVVLLGVMMLGAAVVLFSRKRSTEN